MNILFKVTLIAFIFIASYMNLSAQSFEELNTKLQESFSADNYNEVISTASQIIQQHPSKCTDNIYYQRGFAYLSTDAYDKAAEDFKSAVKINRNFVEAYNALGICYSNNSDNNAALESFTKAIEITPTNSELYFNRGNAYYSKQDYYKASLNFKYAIRLDSNDFSYYYMLGNTFEKMGDKFMGSAVGNWYKAVELNPDLSNELNPKFEKSKSEQNKGKSFAYLISSTNSPGNSNNQAIIESNDKEILFNYNEFPDYTDPFPSPPVVINNSNKNQKNKSKSESFADQISGVDAHNKQKEEKQEKVMSDADYFISGNNNYAGINYTAAISNYTAAITKNANNDKYYNNRGCAYYRNYDFDAALKDFQKAIELNSKNDGYFINIALIYYAKNNFKDAAVNLEKAINLKYEHEFNLRPLIKTLKDKLNNN